MRTRISDLANRVHITLESNYLTDTELMCNEYFIIPIFQLLIEFQHCAECHELKSFPCRCETIIWILLMMPMYNGITLKIRSIDLTFKIGSIFTVDN